MITFIIPPSPFLLDERVFMSLGVLKVAAVVRQQGLVPEVLDLSGVPDPMKLVVLAAQGNPRTFAITTTTPQFPFVFKAANYLRSCGHRVILGGPHITLIMGAAKRGIQRALSHAAQIVSCADTLVSGDGELAIMRALDQYGWIDADDSRSDMFLTNVQFDTSPWPARDLVDVASYHYTIDGHRALSVIGQLGCPMACTFCAGRSSPSFRRIRLRSAQSVVDEIEYLVLTYGVDGFMFYDDELNVNKAFTDLMTGLIGLQDKLQRKLAFRGFIKSELFTPDQAQWMARAGFKTILSGFESGSSQILTNVNKKATVADNTRCVDVAHQHGIKVKALLSLGHPGESETTVAQTYQWLLETRPDDFDVTIITVLPGSTYFEAAVEVEPGVWTYSAPNGDRLHAFEIDYTQVADYYKGVPGSYRSFVYTDFLDPIRLVELRDMIERGGRLALNLPPLTPVEKAYEHSMGQ